MMRGNQRVCTICEKYRKEASTSVAGERPLCMHATSPIVGERQRVCGQDCVVASIREVGCTVNEMASALPDYKKMPAEEELGGRVIQPLPNSTGEKEELVWRVKQLEYQLAKEKLQKRVMQLEGELSERKAKDNLLRDLKDEMAKRNARKALIQELQDELSRRHAIEEEAMAEIEKEEKTAKEIHMHYSQLRFASETNKAAPLTVPPMMPHPLVQGGLPGYAPDAPPPSNFENNGIVFSPNIQQAALLSTNLIQHAAMLDYIQQAQAMNVDPKHAAQFFQQAIMLSKNVEPKYVMPSSKRPLSDVPDGKSSEFSEGLPTKKQRKSNPNFGHSRG